MGAIISMMVTFVAVYLIFQIGRWFILPHHFDGHFEPRAITAPLWGAFCYGMNAIFHYIVAVITVIFIIWWIIKTFVPELFIFFPLRSMLLGLTPFPPMTSAGILPLWEDLSNIIASGAPFRDRLVSFARAIASFLARSVGFLSIANRGPGGGPLFIMSEPPKPPPPPPAKSAEDKMTPDQKRAIDDEYNQCIESSTKPIPPTLGLFEQANLMLLNSSVSIKCGMNKLNTTANLVA